MIKRKILTFVILSSLLKLTRATKKTGITAKRLKRQYTL